MEEETTTTVGFSSLQVTEELRREEKSLAKVPLQPYRYGFGLVTTASESTIPLQTVVKMTAKNERADVVVLFAIRNTTSVPCQDLAKKLSELDKELRHTSFLGIFKERQDDQNILDFYTNHFRFPIYRDSKWRTFMALSERKWTRAFV